MKVLKNLRKKRVKNIKDLLLNENKINRILKYSKKEKKLLVYLV